MNTEYHTDVIREVLADNPRVYTLTTYGSGMRDYVRVFGVKNGGIVDLTFHVAQILGRKVKPNAGIGYNGGGYSKGLDAAMDTYSAIAETLNQGNWSEL